MLQDILKNHTVIKKLHSQLCGKWLCSSHLILVALPHSIHHSWQARNHGAPLAKPLVLEPALIPLAIYFINVVGPVVKRGCAEVLISWLFPRCHKQKRPRQLGALTYYHVLLLPMWSTLLMTLATRMERVRKRRFSKIVFGWDIYVFPPGTFPWTQREHQDSQQRDSSTPRKWIHLHLPQLFVLGRSWESPCTSRAHPGLLHVKT